MTTVTLPGVRWQVECDPQTEAARAASENPARWEFRSLADAQERAERWHSRGAVGVIGFVGRKCIGLHSMDDRGWWRT